MVRNVGYAQTDFNFKIALSVLRIAYYILLVLVVLTTLGMAICLTNETSPLISLPIALPICVIGCLLVHLFYSFLVGFFELVKHAREIRNELVAIRMK